MKCIGHVLLPTNRLKPATKLTQVFLRKEK